MEEDGERLLFQSPTTPEIYPLSLHDALQISAWPTTAARRSCSPSTRCRASCRPARDRKSTRLNSSHTVISYAVLCLKKKSKNAYRTVDSNARRQSTTTENTNGANPATRTSDN